MEAWITTDSDGGTTDLHLAEPERDDENGIWASWSFHELPADPREVGLESYPTWDDEPVKVKLTLTLA